MTMEERSATCNHMGVKKVNSGFSQSHASGRHQLQSPEVLVQI